MAIRSAVAFLVLLVGGCGTGSTWGPLAVADVFGPDALAEGTLRIDATCVVLEKPDGRRLLLVWPSKRTRWEPTGAVVFVRPSGESITVTSGDVVQLGGGEGAFQGDWIAPPHPVCPKGQWLVSDIAIGAGGTNVQEGVIVMGSVHGTAIGKSVQRDGSAALERTMLELDAAE